MSNKIYVGDKLISAAYVGDTKVYEEVTPCYSVTVSGAHCTYSGTTYLLKGETGTITFVPEEGYFIRESDIVVDGADYSFDHSTYVLTITNPYKNVIIYPNCLELYLCFRSISEEQFAIYKVSNITFNGTLEYSVDKINWINIPESAFTTASSKVIYLRGKGNTKIQNQQNTTPFQFTNNTRISMSGAIDSVLDYECVKYRTPLPSVYQDYQRFNHFISGSQNIIDAREVILSDDIRYTTSGYFGLFDGCSNLLYAPRKLPSKSSTTRCCTSMFRFCTSLIEPPKIYIESYKQLCCASMFYGCTSLNKLVELPVITEGTSTDGIREMFSGCTNIKLSLTQDSEYVNEYSIQTSSGTPSSGNLFAGSMFKNTGGTFAGTPTLNTTYYTVNEII